MIMGNPDRPELGAGVDQQRSARCEPRIAQVFARTTFLSDNRADLATVAVPTLVIQCAQDVIAPPEVGAYVHAQIPGSQLVTLAATGHCPQLSAPVEHRGGDHGIYRPRRHDDIAAGRTVPVPAGTAACRSRTEPRASRRRCG